MFNIYPLYQTQYNTDPNNTHTNKANHFLAIGLDIVHLNIYREIFNFLYQVGLNVITDKNGYFSSRYEISCALAQTYSSVMICVE